jgi:DME family drug/metabolite transporter
VAFALGGAAFQICLFAAFDRIGVTLTTAITVCAPPVIVAACDAAFGRRRPDGPLIAAIAGAGVGVALLLWPDGGAAPGGAIDLVGLGLLAGASFSFAAVAVAARALGRALHPVRAAGYGLAAVAGALALVGGASAGGTLAALSGACWRDLGLLAYLGVAATGGAYLAFVGGMRLSRSAATGLAATMVEPAFAGVLAALILGERIGPVAALGCALAFGAVVLLHREETRAAAVVP